MAITIGTQPDNAEVHSAYLPAIYKMTSDDADTVLIKGELYVDGTLTDTRLHAVDIDQTNFTFDFSRQIQDNLSDITDFSNIDLPSVGASGINEADDTLKAIQGKFYEVTQPSTTLIEGTASTDSNSTDFIDGLIQDTSTTTFDDYIGTTGTPKWLTNFPRSVNKPIRLGESEFLSAIFAANASVRIKWVTHDSSGNTIDINTSSLLSSFDRMNIGVGPANLNALIAGSIDADTASYDVWVTMPGQTETLTYRLDHTLKNNTTRFVFKDDLGGWSFFTFTGEKVEGNDVSSEQYQMVLESGFASGDRGSAELSINSVESFSVYSGYHPRATLRWLKELYDSPIVFVEEDSAYVPVIITNKSGWGVSSEGVDQLRVDYVKANNRRRQRN